MNKKEVMKTLDINPPIFNELLEKGISAENETKTDEENLEV